MTATTQQPKSIRSLIPARMDRLPWTRFHWSVIVGLGTAWILDGFEIQIVSAGGYQAQLQANQGLSSATAASFDSYTGTFYLVGQVVGALVFGRLADRLGRKRFFLLTLALYLVGSAIGGFAPTYWFLWIFRFIAGLGIGGEYTAINSAIDEIIPSRFRGRIDIAINGTYWAGAGLAAAASLYLLNQPTLASTGWGWRIGFFIGPVLGIIIIFVRRNIPESPRWQITHGQEREAEANVDRIEATVGREAGHDLDRVPDDRAIDVPVHDRVPFGVVYYTFVHLYPKRAAVAFAMLITQAFLYNSIFFSYATVLKTYFHVPGGSTGLYFLPFAAGNLLGPLLLGPLFDTIGRKRMIFSTYAISGVVLAVSAGLFAGGLLTALTQTIFWCVAFFFASAGASSAYLTVSETFPLQVRGQAISYVFAVGQLAGAFATFLFGVLGSSVPGLTFGYLLGAVLMLIGGIVALVFGVSAEGRSLEDLSDVNFIDKVQMARAA